MKLKVSRFNKKDKTEDIRSIPTTTILFIPIIFIALLGFGTKFQTDMKEVVYQNIEHESANSSDKIKDYNEKYKGNVNINYDKTSHTFIIKVQKRNISIMMNSFYDLKAKRKVEYIILNDKKLQVKDVPELENKFNLNTVRISPIYTKFLEENQKDENIVKIKMSD